MTTYMRLDKCKILCACSRTQSLCRLYFCRHCLNVRCSECLSHEVDSHYCPNCLENMASAEAKMRKHRCGNCFDCPSCGHTLSTRATAVMQAKPDEPGKTMAQKAYYLTCGFCRWSTRDSGIPDQKQSAGGWQESDNPYSKRVSELVDSYHHLAVKEKADREWTKFVRKRNYMILLERYPVLNPRLRRYCTSSWTTPSRDTEPAKPIVIPAADPPAEPPKFDLGPFITAPLQLEKVTTIEQRLLAPLIQPTQSACLEPHPKCLAVKRSMRCRQCEHNLSKADFNPSSIKFRINLSALYHVPEIRYIMVLPTVAETNQKIADVHSLYRRSSHTVSSLKSERSVLTNLSVGKMNPFILTICNPAHRVTTVFVRQLTAEEEAQSLQHLVTQEGAEDARTKPDQDTTNSSSVGSAGDTVSSDNVLTPCFSTVQLSLPTEEIKLSPRNDIADYDENLGSGNLADFKDDPKIVAFRRGNKVGIHAGLTPLASGKCRSSSVFTCLPTVLEESCKKCDATCLPLRAALRLRFDYKNTTSSLLSEHRAVHTAAALASASATSAVKASKDGEDFSVTSPTQASSLSDQVTQIEVTVLLDFGYMEISVI